MDTPATDLAAVEAVAPDTGIQSPEAAVLDAERRRTLTDALAGLPEDRRQPIEAAFFEGYTHSELAQRFGLPLGTVKTRIRAGMLPCGKGWSTPYDPGRLQALALADTIGALDPDERRDLEPAWPACRPRAGGGGHLFDASVEIAASAIGEEPSPGFGTPCSPGLPRRPTTRFSTEGNWVESAGTGLRMKIPAIDRARDGSRC